LTTGYATFAGGGKLSEPYAVLEIRKPTGDIIYSREANASPAPQVESPEIIADLNSMLGAVVKSGTARRADLGYAPQGGKTGTNQGYRDAWYVGFTAHYATGVWVGNDDFSPMNEVTGGRIPAPLWKNIMDVAEQGLKPQGLAGIPLDDSFAQVAVAEPTANTPAIAEESPDATADTAIVASNDPGQDVLNGMLNLFDKKKPVIINGQGRKKTSKARRKVASGDSALRLPRANANRAPKRNFLDSLFRPQGQKKKRKPLFSF
jgi:membrane peptidoglycan carboxypeptidase